MQDTLALGLLVLLAGCGQMSAQQHPREPQGTGDYGARQLRLEREAVMNERWNNRRMSELVAAMGEPERLLSIPGGGSPPSFAAVFGRDPATGCIDAFALVYGSEPTVRAYHCR